MSGIYMLSLLVLYTVYKLHQMLAVILEQQKLHQSCDNTISRSFYFKLAAFYQIKTRTLCVSIEHTRTNFGVSTFRALVVRSTQLVTPHSLITPAETVPFLCSPYFCAKFHPTNEFAVPKCNALLDQRHASRITLRQCVHRHQFGEPHI